MSDFRTCSDCSGVLLLGALGCLGGWTFGGPGCAFGGWVVLLLGALGWLGGWAFGGLGCAFWGWVVLLLGGVWWVAVVVVVVWGVPGGCERNLLSCLGTFSCFTLLIYCVNCWEPVLAERRNMLSCISFRSDDCYCADLAHS